MEAIKSYIKGFFCQEEIIYDEIYYNGNSDNCDMMLNCNSFEQLKKDGWTAIFSKDGYNRYLKSFKNEKGEKFEKIVVGIVGMNNRGKSYLLKRILNNKNYGPKDGFLVTRHGLTCGFPDLPIITLELEGKNSPLLQSEYSNINDIKSIIRDQKVCEILFSDFIIKESNILIAVIEQLNFVEQEMIIALIERLKQKEDDYCEKRRLIVIHNLMEINKPEEIEKYVNNILLQSFFLEKQYVEDHKNSNNNLNIYKQLTNENKLRIVHLVIGNDYCEEVRKKYNEPAFQYIRDYIKIIEGYRCFDILENFKKFIIDNSKKFMRDNYFTENSLEIGEKQLKKICFDKDKKKPPEEKIIIPIKIKNKTDTINLKSFHFSSDDRHYFSNKIEPLYSTRIIEKNKILYLEVTFEMFGILEDLTLNIEYDEDKEVIIIEIKGKNKEINIIGNEEPIKKEVGNLKYEYFNFQVQ